MKKFMALLRVSLLSALLNVAGGRKSKRKKMSGIGTCVLLACIALYVSGVYSGLLIEVLAPIHMEVLVLIFMGLASVFGGMIFSVFGVSKALFGGKDNDLLLAMPVSNAALLAAKMTAIYLEELLFTFFMMVPAGVVCRIFSDAAVYRTVGYWVRLVLSALLLPMLTTALAVLIGALIAWAASRMKRRALGENIMMGVYVTALLWFSFSAGGKVQGLATTAVATKAGLRWALPLVWMGDGIEGDWAAWLKFAATSVVSVTAVVCVLAMCFRRAITAFSSVAARSDYRMSAQRSSGAKRALLRKEARKFFGTPLYFWNSGLGLLMALGLAVAAIVKREDLLNAIEMMNAAAYVPSVCCAVLAFCLSTAAITAPSFSLEGKYWWILRESPMDSKTILRTKIGFQQMLAQPFAIISALCLAFTLEMSATEGVCVALFAALFELFDGLLGAWVGLRHARLDLEERYVIKQSLVAFLGIFAPMLLAVGLGVGVYFLNRVINIGTALWLATAALAALSMALGILLKRNGVKMVEHLGE